MAWIRLDDQIAHHPKFAKAGLSSWVWICCIAYAQKFLTDGFIPTSAVSSIAAGVQKPHSHIKRLLDAGLLDRVSNGYQVHDYLVHNSSATEVKADKEWDRFRKELYSNGDLVKAIKSRDKDRCRYCSISVNWNDRRSDNGGQFDHVIPRGANTLENLVVSCRRCNIAKNKRTLEAAGMVLLPVPELGKNQFRPSSEPVLPSRARASAPARDTHTHTHTPIKKEQKIKAVASPQDNIRLITKFAHEVRRSNGHSSEADVEEDIKLLCASRHVAYSSEVVRKAMESATVQAQHRKHES